MFVNDYPVWRSTLLYADGVGHAFSTRAGGASRLPHTKSMNVGFFRGDSDDLVRNNINVLAMYAGVSNNIVGSPQIHSDEIRVVTPENGGEGITKEVPFPCDGFVTEHKGVSLLIRVADCAPVLLRGVRADGSNVVGAVHAGWNGTALGIAPKACNMLFEMGAEKVIAAIGPCIGDCCFSVTEDRRDKVISLRGREFADRHFTEREGVLYMDIAGMNKELLLEAGAAEVDVLSDCTCCRSWIYHSHRATGGERGTMGAMIGLV